MLLNKGPEELRKVTITVCQSGGGTNRTITFDVSQVMQEVFDCLFLTDAEKERGFDEAVAELIRKLPDYAKCLATVASIPPIQARAVSYFLAMDVPLAEAEELAGDIALKILKSVYGGWPHGNMGAWVAQLRYHVGVDYQRRQCRIRKWLGKRREGAELANAPDPAEAREELNRQISEMPIEEREIFKRRRYGDNWPVIAEDLGMSVKAARKMAYREWPGGCSPRSRKSRRNSRSSRR